MGNKIMAMVAAANMDPNVNEDPEKLDLQRHPKRRGPVALASQSLDEMGGDAQRRGCRRDPAACSRKCRQ
jgi:cytochrome P450